MKEVTHHGEVTYNLTDASVADLSTWLEEVKLALSSDSVAVDWKKSFRAGRDYLYITLDSKTNLLVSLRTG